MRDLGIDVDDALKIAEQTEIRGGLHSELVRHFILCEGPQVHQQSTFWKFNSIVGHRCPTYVLMPNSIATSVGARFDVSINRIASYLNSLVKVW